MSTKNDTWTAVDRYVSDVLLTGDRAAETALETSAAAGLPAISVSAPQGKLLYLVARAMGARRILEVGTLGGYSAIFLARALPAGGRLITLELSPKHADVARANLAQAGLGDRVDVRVGPAADSMKALVAERGAPFDLIFIDADKVGYPEYFRLALALSRPGTLIVTDNVVRDGAVADAASDDANVRAVRTLHEMIAAEPRVTATVIQTVGTKGYDGLGFALVTS